MTAAATPQLELTVDKVISCSAGVPTTVEVQVWYRGPRPASITVAIRGLDAEWTPEPVVLGTVSAGDSVTTRLELRPGPSALGARYPFAVVAVAADPLGRGEPELASAESALVIGSREPTVLELDPPQVTAVFGRRVRLTITNPSLTDRELSLQPTVPAGLSAEFGPSPVGVPAGRTVTLRGKVRVRRPRVFGTVQTHSYAVAARGQGAPVVVTGTVKARPVFRGALVRALVLLAVVALWAGLAVVAIPRVSAYFTNPETQQSQAGGAAQTPPAGSSTSPAPGGGAAGAEGQAGGQGGDQGGGQGGGAGSDQGGGQGGGAGSDQSGGDQGGAGQGGADTGGAASPGTDQSAGGAGPSSGTQPGGPTSGAQSGGQTSGTQPGGETSGEQPGSASGAPSDEVSLRGLVTGPDPGGVTVILGPTSLTEAAEQNAEPAPGSDEQTASALRAAKSVIGKVPSTALRLATAQDTPTVTTTTNDDGTWAIAGIRPQGFYLLTLARAGYQTQRFIVNGATLVGADPMRVALLAGDGAMSGTVTGPNGPVGAATVTITDGRVSVQTSTVSPGAEGTPGSWSVTGLSTPGTYLVSAAAQGFGTASALVTLGAGGTATSDLTLQTGVAAVTGLVSGEDQLGQLGGLGGMSVSITGRSGDVTTTRTATTVTTGPVGRFTLPDLPTPGDYTLTVSGDGYSDQVRTVSLAAGVGSVDVNVSLIRANGVVSGTVFGNPASGDQPAEGGLVGAGLTLTGPAGSTKTMTTSDPPGSYRFTGVAPGVYVLSGSMFGRLPSSVTVEVTAAGQATADLTLLSSADTELPATAHIQGRVTDSRTGGDLTCDRAVDPGVPCVITASVSVPAIDPNTGRIDPDAPPQIVTAQANPGEPYLLPAADDPDHKGLVPGLYTVNISAPGYEPGSVSVQVPQGATMSAAPVSLVPLSLITGRLTTRVGTPKDPTCVAVVPAGTTPPDRSAGCTAAADTINCVVGNDPSIRCGLIQPDGTYQVRGLVHGTYTVVVLPTDPEYIEPTPFSVSIELGSDGRYDPILDRLGRISVTVRQPDPNTGDLAPADAATVQAVQGSTVVASATTDANGAALLTALPSGTYRVQASGGGANASADDEVVQLNQTLDLGLVIIKPLGTIVGRVVTTDGVAADGVPVPNATTAVTGIVGYTGTTSILGTATVITDDNGCFAIVPSQVAGPVTGSTDLCPTISDPASIGTMVPGPFLVARPVSVQVSPTDVSQGAFSPQVSIEDHGTILRVPAGATSVKPKPSPTTGLDLRTLPTGQNRGQAALSLLAKSPASGQVSVQETSVGTLQWTDSAVTGTNLLSPGPYLVQATLPGFTGLPAKGAHVQCGLGQPCGYVSDTANDPTSADPQLRLVRNPAFSGSVTVLPGSANIAAAVFTVTPLDVKVPAVSLSLTGSGTTLSWQEQGAPANLVTPGSYSVSVSLPGFESTPVTFTCGVPSTGTETCPLPTLSLTQQSTQTLTLASNGGLPPTGATVVLTGNSIGTIGPLNAQNVGGAIQVALPPVSALNTSSYRLTVRAPGFTSATFTPDSPASCIPAGRLFQPGPSSCTLTLNQLGRINVTTQQLDPDGNSPLSNVTVTATPLLGGDPWTIVTGPDGTGQFIGTLQRDGLDVGPYQLTASRTGYTTTSTPLPVVIGAGNLSPSVTLALPVKPVTFRVNLLDKGTSVLPAGTVSVVGENGTRSCTITDPANPVCTSSDPNTSVNGGMVAFAQLTPGVYTVSFQPTGQVYQSVSVQTQVAAGIDPQTLRMNLARRSSNQTGTVRDPNGALLAGAQVSLRQNNDVTQIANDLSGNPLPTVTTGADGAYTFSDVPDGLYRVMVDACGYDRAFSDPITLNSQVQPTPPAVTVRVARTVRSVVVSVTSTSGASLVGASASFQPATGGDAPSCTPPANTTGLTGLTVAADGTVSTSQLPTGTWSLVVTPAASPFGSVATDPFLADQPDRGEPKPPPNTVPTAPTITQTREVRQASMTLTASWPDQCSPPPTAVTMTLTRDPGGPDEDTRTLNATITHGTGNAGTATVTALLPAGSYDWSVAAGDYTAQPASGSFTVPATGATPAVPIQVDLLSPGVSVRPTVTVDGAARTGVPMTATPSGGGPAIPDDGTGLLCLAPGSGWTFSVRSAADPTMLIPDVTGVTVTRAGPNTVTFTGFTLQPGVTLATVANRTPDTTARNVALTLTLGGTTVWTGTATIPASGTSGDGPTLTIGAGSYTLSAAANDPFGAASQSGIDPSTTHTATLTLPYTAVTLTVTASRAGTDAPGAAITLTPASGSPSPVPRRPSSATSHRAPTRSAPP